MKSFSGRRVEAELLDELPPADPRALHSRRDLVRLNIIMRHPQIMAAALSQNLNVFQPARIVELGAGDGHFLLNVARRIPATGGRPGRDAVLVDRLDTFDPAIANAFKNSGWQVQTQSADVFEWLSAAPPNSADAVIGNLFLHHFQPAELSEMLRLAANCTKLFVALEPRRSWLPMLCGKCLWLIGCGPVTCHDAVVSIRAGFKGAELSSLWPDRDRWHVQERRAGLFSHLFIGRRKE